MLFADFEFKMGSCCYFQEQLEVTSTNSESNHYYFCIDQYSLGTNLIKGNDLFGDFQWLERE